jgi:hypothetical protein
MAKSRKYWLAVKKMWVIDLKYSLKVLHKNGPMVFTSKKIHKDSWGLDVEYKKNKWCPLSSEGFMSVDKKDMHWSKLNKNRPIGYQGPLILWSDLKKLPELYYK